MAFGTHNISSVRYNRNLQNDYRSRAKLKKSALRDYFSKARRKGALVKDHLSKSERAEVRARLKARKRSGQLVNITMLFITILLVYSMVTYLT